MGLPSSPSFTALRENREYLDNLEGYDSTSNLLEKLLSIIYFSFLLHSFIESKSNMISLLSMLDDKKNDVENNAVRFMMESMGQS